MLFRQGDKQLGGPPSGSTEGSRALHESYDVRFTHLKNRNSSVCSLRLMSSQETSTHDSGNRALLS